MKKAEVKEMSNFELLSMFQALSDNMYGARPTKKAFREFGLVVTELGQRLGLSDEEVKEIIER